MASRPEKRGRNAAGAVSRRTTDRKVCPRAGTADREGDRIDGMVVIYEDGKEVIRDPKVMARMRMTLDLFETAKEMMRMNLRRRYPEAGEAEIKGRLIAWLQKRRYSPPAEPSKK